MISATEDVMAKKDGAPAAYKEAVNCKACHSEHKIRRVGVALLAGPLEGLEVEHTRKTHGGGLVVRGAVRF